MTGANMMGKQSDDVCALWGKYLKIQGLADCCILSVADTSCFAWMAANLVGKTKTNRLEGEQLG